MLRPRCPPDSFLCVCFVFTASHHPIQVCDSFSFRRHRGQHQELLARLQLPRYVIQGGQLRDQLHNGGSVLPRRQGITSCRVVADFSADFPLIFVILLPAVPRAACLVLPAVDVPRALQVLLLGVVILFDYVYCTRRRAGIKPAFPTPCPQPHFTMADEGQVLREERR